MKNKLLLIGYVGFILAAFWLAFTSESFHAFCGWFTVGGLQVVNLSKWLRGE